MSCPDPTINETHICPGCGGAIALTSSGRLDTTELYMLVCRARCSYWYPCDRDGQPCAFPEPRPLNINIRMALDGFDISPKGEDR